MLLADLAARFRPAEQLRVEAGRLAVGEQAVLWELWQDEIVGVLLGAGVGAEEVDLQVPLGLGAANSSLCLFQGCPCEVSTALVRLLQVWHLGGATRCGQPQTRHLDSCGGACSERLSPWHFLWLSQAAGKLLARPLQSCMLATRCSLSVI